VHLCADVHGVGNMKMGCVRSIGVPGGEGGDRDWTKLDSEGLYGLCCLRLSVG